MTAVNSITWVDTEIRFISPQIHFESTLPDTWHNGFRHLLEKGNHQPVSGLIPITGK